MNQRLRKANEFGIPWYSIRADIVFLKAILHIYASCFIKIDAPPLHDTHDLLLSSIVQALARITSLDISTEIESV